MRALALTALTTLLLFAPPTVRAQDDERAAAEARFRDGMAAASEQRWEDALQAFEEAFELAPIPDILLNIGSARGNLGQLVEGRDAYRELLRRAETEDISHRVVEAARNALDQLDDRVGRVRVQAENAITGDELSLCDSEEQSCRDLSLHDTAGAEVNPGDYLVRLQRDGTVLDRSSVTVEEGGVEYVNLIAPAPEATPEQDAEVGGVFARGGDSSEDGGQQQDDDSGTVFASPWFWLTVGLVAVAGAGAGIFFGAGLNEADPILGNVGSGISTVR